MNSRDAWKKLCDAADPEDLAHCDQWTSISFNQFRKFWCDYMESNCRIYDAYLEYGGLPKRTLQQLRDECTE